MIRDEDDITLHYCQHGDQAIAMALQVKPTVILQDITMPDIDGLTLLQQYRQQEAIAETPVLMLSATNNAETKAAAFDMGANDYLVKMPHKIEFLARIRYHTKAYIGHKERRIAICLLEEGQKKLALAYKELERLASIDGLTNIANRRHFDETFSMEWSRAMRETESLSLIMIDIDYFKQYNDSYGHLAGDECLKLVAATLQQSLQRPTDLAARFGGEEFVIILPGTHARGATKIAERIRKEIIHLQLPHENSETNDCVSISLGVATVAPMLRHDPSELLFLADSALYEAKDTGRNRVVCAGL